MPDVKPETTYEAVNLLFITALPAEAQPLLQTFTLKQSNQRGFRLFSNQSVHLVISGIGRIRAAAATAFALSRLSHRTVVVNVGIAGSDNPLGTIYFANSVRETDPENIDSDKRVTYPSTPFTTNMPGIAVHTVAQPSSDYRADVAYDMEASAVVTTARRFLGAEQVHCLKIISDNPQTPVFDDNGHLSKAVLDTGRITELIDKNLLAIIEFAETLRGLISKLPTSPDADQPSVSGFDHMRRQLCLQHLNDELPRLSVSQRHQLNVLCKRFEVLGKDVPETLPMQALSSGSALISYLEDALTNAYPDYTRAPEAPDA